MRRKRERRSIDACSLAQGATLEHTESNLTTLEIFLRILATVLRNVAITLIRLREKMKVQCFCLLNPILLEGAASARRRSVIKKRFRTAGWGVAGSEMDPDMLPSKFSQCMFLPARTPQVQVGLAATSCQQCSSGSIFQVWNIPPIH